MDTFRLRLNCVDHYQCSQSHFDPNLQNGDQTKSISKVPVIRVFGSTETGQKVCAHIHGAFPYLYIEYLGSNSAPNDVEKYISTLHLSIDHALAVSFRRNQSGENAAFVARITLVKGIPFYGFHVGYKAFLKIYLYNPSYMNRLADVLLQGAVLQTKFQPYESHMQYILQWMCDYNLYGCAYIDCGKVMFRHPIPSYEDEGAGHKWHDRSIVPKQTSHKFQFQRQSHCSIEVDVMVQDILNRKDIETRSLHHDFIERLRPNIPGEKFVHSMAGLWKDETRRRKAMMSNPDDGSSPFPPEVLVTVSADLRNSQPGGWIHEEEFREHVNTVIDDERQKVDGPPPTYENFVQPLSFEDQIPTAIESVEDLFVKNLQRSAAARELSFREGKADENAQGVIDVDEAKLTLMSEEEFLNDSDDIDQNLHPRKEAADSRALEQDQPDAAAQLVKDQISEERLSSGETLQVEAPISIISPRELDALGVREHGDLNYLDEDNFQIPELFASGLVAKTSLKRSAPSSQSGHDSKKPKIINGGRVHFEEDATETWGSQNLSHTNPMSSGESVERHGRFFLRTQLPDVNTSQKKKKEISPSKTPDLSQTSAKSSQNKNLPFPVVKDPHNPATIRRLNRQSGSQKFSGPKKPSDSPKTAFSQKSSKASAEASMKSGSTVLLSSSSTSISASEDKRESMVIRKLAMSNGLMDLSIRGAALVYGLAPPTTSYIVSSMMEENHFPEIHQNAFYSNENDAPEKPRNYGGREFKLESGTVPFLPDFDQTGLSDASRGEKPPMIPDTLKMETLFRRRSYACSLRNWEIAEPPPTTAEVESWLNATEKSKSPDQTKSKRKSATSQIDGPTQKNPYGCKFSQKKESKSTSVQHEAQYMSLMSLEVHVNTRGKLLPNPEHDEIGCIFWCVQSDDDYQNSSETQKAMDSGIILLSGNDDRVRNLSKLVTVEIEEENSELDLINRLVSLVRLLDPDIITGYEVHDGSWGYIIERARLKYDYDICDELSRTKSQSHGRSGKDNDKWGFTHTSSIRITGRHMINIWRAMSGELNLLQYTQENVTFHLMQRRIPHYRCKDLTEWFQSNKPRELSKVVDYYLSRCRLDLEILEHTDIIPRTSEQARLLGVDFFSVFSRGSQFKVESLMFRIAKPENFMLVSPDRNQVGGQNALECLPLVMEPQSAFYNSPLLVLDFTSLYPSIMIAYNYCYSTFLGRVYQWRGKSKMGFTEYKRQQKLLELLKDQINLAPNGMIYAKPTIRKSILAKMLGEILETRVMVKSGMKQDKKDKVLQRLLNNRQLALKLIANVTYGYTSASFSGRMPCSEIADSIVQTARETLEKAIALIHSVEKWGAEVVYGDTDSLFVYLKGRTKEEAFNIGEEIAKKVTETNPRPVKLKFEKVYFPCVLLAKKRYVGYKYESRTQKVPYFDAKGIETVRRDGTPAEQKIEEKALKILFETADLSQVKDYFQKQCSKIMRGKVSIQDFCFAKEVRLGTYSAKGPPPPGALISTRKMLEDPRAEPQYGERVPYLVITGAPGARLIDRCVAPEALLHDEHVDLDSEYYISKNIIPPLERIFNLVGANVRAWYDEMPKAQRIRNVVYDQNQTSNGNSRPNSRGTGAMTKKTMESYMKSSQCVVCRAKLDQDIATTSCNSGIPLCPACAATPDTTLLALRRRLAKEERRAQQLSQICRSCAGLAWGEEVRCDSHDCNIFYSRTRQMALMKSQRAVELPVVASLEAGLAPVVATAVREGGALNW